MEMTVFVPAHEMGCRLLDTSKNLINALNEVLLHSGAFHHTQFTHWGANKVASISIRMKVSSPTWMEYKSQSWGRIY